LPDVAKKFNRVGPIVRANVKPVESSGTISKIVIMLSGSTFGSDLSFERDSYPFKIEVVGRSQPDNAPPHPDITYHGKLENSLKVLRDGDLIVVNGGFSAVSEGLVLQKPLVVIPVPNHAEQWINARTIETLGVGLMCTEENFEAAIFQALETLPQYIDAYCRLPAGLDAAGDAADIILNTKFE
jgi:hypothetical protein